MRMDVRRIGPALVWSAFFISLGGRAVTQDSQDAVRPQSATVRIAVMRDRGFDWISDLADMNVTLFQQKLGGPNFADRFFNGLRRNKAIGIPYGTYQLGVYLPDFWGAVYQTVEVSAPDVLVLIDARIKPVRDEGPRPTAEGRRPTTND